MNKDNLSSDEVEQLLAELAPPTEQVRRRTARMEQSRQRACRAARSEINRVFFRRYCVRAAECVTVLCLMGGALSLLWTAEGEKQEAPVAVNDIPVPVVAVDSVDDDEFDVAETEWDSLENLDELAEEETLIGGGAPAPMTTELARETTTEMTTAAVPASAPSAAGPIADVPEGSPVQANVSNAYAVPGAGSSPLAQNERGVGNDYDREANELLCRREPETVVVTPVVAEDEEEDLAFSKDDVTVDASRSVPKAESMPSDLVCRAPAAQAPDLAMTDKQVGFKARSAKKASSKSVAKSKNVKPAAKKKADKPESAPYASVAPGPDSLLWQLALTLDKMEIKGDDAVLTLTLQNAGARDMTVGNTPQSLKETAPIRSPKGSMISSKSEILACSDGKKLGTIVVPALGATQLTMTFNIRPEANNADREKLLNKLRRAELQFTFTYFKFGKSEWFDVFHCNAAMGKK